MNQIDIINADDGDIGGDFQPMLLQRFHDAYGGDIVGTENGSEIF